MMISPHNNTKRKKINLFLSGGGTKCSFQVGFLERLVMTHQFRQRYTVGSIYCVSFGSLVGLFYVLDKLDRLKKLLLASNERTIEKVFDLWGLYHVIRKIPILGALLDLIWLIKGIFMKGLYRSSFGNAILDELFKDIDRTDPVTIKKLSRFNCFVFNITKNCVERINGMNPRIREYIVASICCWGLFPPISIEQEDGTVNEFLDAGFIQVHPHLNLVKSTSTKSQFRKRKKQISLLLMTNTIQNMHKTHLGGTRNLIEYLISIISYLIDRSDRDLVQRITRGGKNMHVIEYLPRVTYPNEFDSVKIDQMMKDGDERAIAYLRDVLL